MPFSFDSSIGFVINKAALRLKSELARAFSSGGYNVTPEHWAILNCLWDKDGQTQVQIGARVAKDKTNMTRILTIMVRNGLVERRAHETDGRSSRVFLTRTGMDLEKELVPIAESVLNRASVGLSRSDLRMIHDRMTRIVKNLE